MRLSISLKQRAATETAAVTSAVTETETAAAVDSQAVTLTETRRLRR